MFNIPLKLEWRSDRHKTFAIVTNFAIAPIIILYTTVTGHHLRSCHIFTAFKKTSRSHMLNFETTEAVFKTFLRTERKFLSVAVISEIVLYSQLRAVM